MQCAQIPEWLQLYKYGGKCSLVYNHQTAKAGLCLPIQKPVIHVRTKINQWFIFCTSLSLMAAWCFYYTNSCILKCSGSTEKQHAIGIQEAKPLQLLLYSFCVSAPWNWELSVLVWSWNYLAFPSMVATGSTEDWFRKCGFPMVRIS